MLSTLDIDFTRNAYCFLTNDSLSYLFEFLTEVFDNPNNEFLKCQKPVNFCFPQSAWRIPKSHKSLKFSPLAEFGGKLDKQRFEYSGLAYAKITSINIPVNFRI